MKKVLIANRGEVALRIQATCHSRDLETVAVFAPEDRGASFVYRATQAHPLSLSGTSAYFNQEEIISIALKLGADSIHPGYGFLSENAGFAQKVIDAGLTWIGPDPACISLMSDKVHARDMMHHAGVPVVPGFVIHDLSDMGRDDGRKRATELGYPVIIKDPKSGGGKAMRRVDSEADFDRGWDGVLAESKKLTNSTFVLIEKYVQYGRHVEVQVAGDGKQFVHLFERECSIQRRHQKIIEETPCAFVDGQNLEKMYAAAITAAQAVFYNSIGTVEFMVTPNQEFYFLEMNTRLQVEHAVTELVTGIDLVGLQLDLAKNRNLNLQQSDITRRGHAIECRLYSEDPSNRFTPSTGKLHHVAFPSGPWIRFEHDLAQGMEVTPFFDPMLAKVVTYGQTRKEAKERMINALNQLKVEGIKTNRLFLRSLLSCEEFDFGAFHTQLLTDPVFMDRMITDVKAGQQADIIAGLAVLLVEQENQAKAPNMLPAISTDRFAVRRWKEQQWK